MKGNGFVVNIIPSPHHARDCDDIAVYNCLIFDHLSMTLMVHAHDFSHIVVYNCLIFNHLFGQTIGAFTSELLTSERKWGFLSNNDIEGSRSRLR